MTNRFTYKRKKTGQVIEAYQFFEESGSPEQTGFFPHWFLDLIAQGIQFNPAQSKWRIQLTGKTPLALDNGWWIIRIPVEEITLIGGKAKHRVVTHALGTCTNDFFSEEFEPCQ